jgi:DNA polymerase-3 subunit epsilon
MEPVVHCIDFEGSRRTGIVEYGVVTLRGDAVLRLECRLCSPKSAIPEAERAVHGLDESLLASSAPFEQSWDLFRSLRASGVLAAHSASVESHLLKSVWPYPGLMPDWIEPGRAVADWGPWIDTERLARPIPMESTKLERVVHGLGLFERLEAAAALWCPAERRRWHCAPYDALACALALVELRRRLSLRSLRQCLLLSAPSRIGV